MLKSSVEVFLQDLNVLDIIFGFLVRNCLYSRLETSGDPQFGQQITKSSFEQVFVGQPDQWVTYDLNSFKHGCECM